MPFLKSVHFHSAWLRENRVAWPSLTLCAQERGHTSPTSLNIKRHCSGCICGQIWNDEAAEFSTTGWAAAWISKRKELLNEPLKLYQKQGAGGMRLYTSKNVSISCLSFNKPTISKTFFYSDTNYIKHNLSNTELTPFSGHHPLVYSVLVVRAIILIITPTRVSFLCRPKNQIFSSISFYRTVSWDFQITF